MKEPFVPMNRRGAALRTLTLCTGALALAMASGCSAADDGDMPSNGPGAQPSSESDGAEARATRLDPATPFFDGEESLNLLAAVGLEGRVIKFFEPEEGTVLEVELIRGAVKADPNEKGLSGSALYSYLTKSEAPAALLDAEWRVNDLAARNGIDVVKEAKDFNAVVDDVGAEMDRQQEPARELPGNRPTAEWEESVPFLPLNQVSEWYFLDKYCTPTDRFWSCGGVPNRICVGSTRFEASGVNMMQSGVWSGDGTHLYSTKYGAWTRFDISIHPTEVWGWRRTSGTDRTPYSKVVHGGSGWYRHCVNYHF